MAVWARWIGYLSLIVLIAAWVAFWDPLRFWSSDWYPSIYEMAMIGTGLAAILGVIAGWKGSKVWYVPAGLNLATCALMLAGLAV